MKLRARSKLCRCLPAPGGRCAFLERKAQSKELDCASRCKRLRQLKLLGKKAQNTNALRSQLTWTDYRALLRVEDDEARSWYIEPNGGNTPGGGNPIERVSPSRRVSWITFFAHCMCKERNPPEARASIKVYAKALTFAAAPGHSLPLFCRRAADSSEYRGSARRRRCAAPPPRRRRTCRPRR